MSEAAPTSRDNLHYVCDILEQLKVVSAAHGGPFLTYLLDMAKTEAVMELQRRGGVPSRQKRNATV